MKPQARCSIGFVLLLISMESGCGHDAGPAIPPPPTQSQPQAEDDAPFGPLHRTEAVALATKLAKQSTSGIFDVGHPIARFATVVIPLGTRHSDASASSTPSPCWLISFPVAPSAPMDGPAPTEVSPSGPPIHPVDTPKLVPDTPLYAGGKLVAATSDAPPVSGPPPSMTQSHSPTMTPGAAGPPRSGLPSNGSPAHILPPGVLSTRGGGSMGSPFLIYIQPDGRAVIADPRHG
jgi:hypothetical protein